MEELDTLLSCYESGPYPYHTGDNNRDKYSYRLSDDGELFVEM